MTVSITGATGFIGRKLVQRLHAGQCLSEFYIKQLLKEIISLLYYDVYFCILLNE